MATAADMHLFVLWNGDDLKQRPVPHRAAGIHCRGNDSLHRVKIGGMRRDFFGQTHDGATAADGGDFAAVGHRQIPPARLDKMVGHRQKSHGIRFGKCA